MKKIYYLQTHPVKIGGVIEHNGFRATVTEELIKFNPELFKIEEEKTLEDYEDILCTLHQGELERSVVYNGNIYSISIGLFYKTLKLNEPKLYYTKILQLIADDLNDGRYIHERGQASYHLSDFYGANTHCGGDEGCVYFKSEELAKKARDIMGDKVKYLFNN